MKSVFLSVAFAAGLVLPLCAEEVTGDDAMSAVAGWVNVKAALGELSEEEVLARVQALYTGVRHSDIMKEWCAIVNGGGGRPGARLFSADTCGACGVRASS